MRLLTVTALVAQLVAAASWAATPKACRPCHTACGDTIAACIAAATASCPASPRAKTRRCVKKAKRHCKKATVAACIDSCRGTGSPVCSTPQPAECVPYTSTCTAVPVTPAVTSMTDTQVVYRFLAHTGSPGPGGCCVIDTCSGMTQFNTSAGPLGAQYDENIDTSAGVRALGDTEISAGCSVPTNSAVYGLSNIYSVRFSIFPPEFPVPPAPVDWPSPYTLAPGDLGVSVDTTTDTISSDAMISFKPSTWRLVSASVSVDKVCAEQQLMQGHAVVSFIKNDGTPCTVTIYSQGTRTVVP
jgi:hypothetical protein